MVPVFIIGEIASLLIRAFHLEESWKSILSEAFILPIIIFTLFMNLCHQKRIGDHLTENHKASEE